MATVEIITRGERTLPDLAAVANREHRLAREAAVSMVGHAIRCGETLAAIKARLPHGEWLRWVADNFEASPRTAQHYMRLAANTTRVSHLPDLSLRQAIDAVSTPVREDEAHDHEPEGEDPVVWAEVGERLRAKFGAVVNPQLAEYAVAEVLRQDDQRRSREAKFRPAPGPLTPSAHVHDNTLEVRRRCPECAHEWWEAVEGIERRGRKA